ncbi:ribosome biogenesis GTP-binding protein YihA/YsxC [Buchnera aphidicola]|uniref:ribosome biogenesis GTP-binding protein YihA/YsxC n=1 Tax=Buchnera aphidicola TaxID=9 RepID=UPI00346435EA
MNLNYHSISFLKSFLKFKKININIGSEIALLGYSNVGKSTLINALSNNKRLSKTSKNPGQTKLINFFKINKFFRIVDLPGYGYSKNSKKVQKKYNLEVNKYIKNRFCLFGVILLMDIRNPLKIIDIDYLKISLKKKLKILILLNKVDKIKNFKRKLIFKYVSFKIYKKFNKKIKICFFSFKEKIFINKLKNKIFCWYKNCKALNNKF